ncbi:DUF2254 domain-containing protein [Wenxinia saemankumensis]|uniref:DUF2254 domain-containing protein n=1 Tax=Wenxinia saemankumensis TaxID=1447782 RepID=UPI00147D363D|nr:DUF2254 domain-containing protein [Wenxinia saemankumensis]
MRRAIGRLWRRLWVRAVLVAVLGLSLVGLSRLIGGLVPVGVAEALGLSALPGLLEILATSMLTVTTFSLTAVVTVFRSASQQFTPRMHRDLMTDRPTQTALATFIGAWIFALAALVAIEQPTFTEDDRAALFLATLLVAAVIVIEMLRWMVHLQGVGSLLHLGARVEREGLMALRDRQDGAWAEFGRAGPGTPPGREIRVEEPVYLQQVNPADLLRLAAADGARIHLAAGPGAFLDAGAVLARIEGGTERTEARLRKALHLGATRTEEQDPRFALVELSELGSKALSPGVNDLGTAIDVTGRIARVLQLAWPPAPPREGARVTIPALRAEDVLDDGFAAIARDGAHLIEVQLFVLGRLRALAGSGDPGMQAAAREMAAHVARQARGALSSARDMGRLEAACGWIEDRAARPGRGRGAGATE